MNAVSPYKKNTRPALLLLSLTVSMLLSSCALQLERSPAMPASSSSRAPTPAESSPSMPSVSAQSGTTANAQSEGINREGRVIQLGRFTESAPEFTPPSNNSVELNYEQEDLRLVFEQLGSALGISMLIDPTIDQKVSLRTSPSSPLQYQDIWPLMRLLARNAGITIEQAGAVWEFKTNGSDIPAQIVLPEGLSSATASVVLQLTPLTYVSVDAAQTVLQPLLQPEGSVTRLGSGNLLGISGTPAQLARVNALLAVIDDDPFQNQGIHLYELSNSKASDVALELQNVLQLIEGEQPAYQVLGLDRINAVLVVSPASRGFEEVTRWIKILDAESQEQVEQVFVYRVKNLKAVTLAETLSQLFDEEEDQNAGGVITSRTIQPTNTTTNGAPVVNLATSGFLAAMADSINLQQGNGTSANITVTIVADEETNNLLILATPREYRQLLTTLSNMDRVTPQVLINAVIGQVTLTDGTRFGIDWTRVSGNLSSGPAELTASFMPTSVLNSTGQVIQGSGLVLSRSFMDGSAVIDATLNAIAEDNEVTLLSRPTILATNNKEGSIHVGQSVPVNNGTSTANNGTTTANIGYQNVGVDLIITPQINDDGYIRMEIEQKLSSVEEGSVGVADNPTFTDQSIVTSVVVSDQNTITLGGLIQEEDSDQQTGIPGIQKIPALGRLFSYNETRRTRRELFVILRPQIVYGDERDDTVQREMRSSFSNVSALMKEAGL